MNNSEIPAISDNELTDASDDGIVVPPELTTDMFVTRSVFGNKSNRFFNILTVNNTRYREWEHPGNFSFFLRIFRQSYEYARYRIEQEGNHLSGIRMRVKALDPEGIADERIIRFRIPLEEVENPYFEQIMSSYLKGNHYDLKIFEEYEGSDTLANNFILFDLSAIEFLHERTPRSTELTMVCGQTRLHGNYFIKLIDTVDHRDVDYLSRDCSIMVLNEVTGQRFKPEDIRKEMFTSSKGILRSSYKSAAIGSDRTLNYLAKVYKRDLTITDVISGTSSNYKATGNISTVTLYKLGTCIGVADMVYDNFQDKPLTVPKTTHNEIYVFYDLETVQDTESKKFRVYSYSIIINRGNKESEVITLSDSNVDYVESKLVTWMKTVLSNDGDFENSTPERDKENRYYLFAWNGSRFDHRILLSLLRDSQFNISNVIINGANELLSSLVRFKSSPHCLVLRDPCKVFPGTLNSIASIFGFRLKDDFDHDKVEKAFKDKSTWSAYFETIRNQVNQYNTYDTQILAMVTTELKAIVETPIIIEGTETKIVYTSVLSRSMIARKIWKKSLPEPLQLFVFGNPSRRLLDGDFSIPRLPTNPYHEIKFSDGIVFLHQILDQAVVGGRTQTPKGKAIVTNSIQIDARSMYPSQAVSQEYPYGDIVVSNSDNYQADKLGLWEVNVISQGLPTVLPLRMKGKTLNWSYTGSMTVWATNVSINEMIRLGYKFKVIRGFYWESSTTDYFRSYMSHFYNERLSLKEKIKGTTDAELLRELKVREEDAKIKLNALTGSLLQSNFKDFVKIGTAEEISTFYKKYASVIRLSNSEELGDRFITSFDLKKLEPGDGHKIRIQQEACEGCVTENPNILTCFILEYSRACLLQTWTAIENETKGCIMYMCDTDSLLFTNRDYVLEKMDQLSLVGKELGKWGFDFFNIRRGVVIRPKFYALKGYKDEGSTTVEEKVRVKGVTSRSLVSTSSNQYLFTAFGKDYNMDFDNRSIDYMSILTKIADIDGIISEENKMKYLGAKFEHVESVFNGAYMQVLHFQMRKGFNGVTKKYVVINMAEESDEYRDNFEDTF